MKMNIFICSVAISIATLGHSKSKNITEADQFVEEFKKCVAGFELTSYFYPIGGFSVPIELTSYEERFTAAKRIHDIFPLIESDLKIELASYQLAGYNNQVFLYQVTFFGLSLTYIHKVSFLNPIFLAQLKTLRKLYQFG